MSLLYLMQKAVQEQGARAVITMLAGVCAAESFAPGEQTEDQKDLRELAIELQELAKRTYV